MSKPQARNDLNAAVPKFCFELETHRRTPEGRVRSPQEFLAHFFPHDAKSSTDRLFKNLPTEVRAPILTTWGVRGRKSALRDDDAKVQSVVHDALVAGDIDAGMFEEALPPDIIMRWIDLGDWWRFWRGGKITKYTILRALESGYEAALFDAEWFLDALRGHGGRLKGTDVLAEGLSKADLTEWIRHIHESGDGSPKGLVGALGWDQIVAKTAEEVLILVLDALATKVGLVVVDAPAERGKGETPKAEGKADAKVAGGPGEAKPGEGKSADAKPDPKLPGILIPATAGGAGVLGAPPALPGNAPPAMPGNAPFAAPGALASPQHREETIDGASLFKDDEMIPISAEEDDDGEGGGGGKRPSQHPGRGSKPPPPPGQGKRGSKSPPPIRK